MLFFGLVFFYFNLNIIEAIFNFFWCSFMQYFCSSTMATNNMSNVYSRGFPLHLQIVWMTMDMLDMCWKKEHREERIYFFNMLMMFTFVRLNSGGKKLILKIAQLSSFLFIHSCVVFFPFLLLFEGIKIFFSIHSLLFSVKMKLFISHSWLSILFYIYFLLLSLRHFFLLSTKHTIFFNINSYKKAMHLHESNHVAHQQ